MEMINVKSIQKLTKKDITFKNEEIKQRNKLIHSFNKEQNAIKPLKLPKKL